MPQYPASFWALSPAGAISSGVVDAQGGLGVSPRHADNYGAANSKTVFMGANTTGIATTVGLAATYTGLCLSNPVASGKNLALLRVSGAYNVAPTVQTIFRLIAGFAAGGITVHGTPLVPLSTFIGSAAPATVAKLDAACTLVGTPAWGQVLAVTPAATSTVAFSVPLDGAIIIPPGGYIAIGTDVASSALGFFGSMMWEENPV